MRFGVDYTSAIPPATLRANGVTFVARYLAPDSHSFTWKKITPVEAAQLKGAGIDIVLVWESSAKRALDGRNAGVSDAAQASVQAKRLGLQGAPIYFAVDFDVPDFAPSSHDAKAKLGPIAAYFEGVSATIGFDRAGVYGGFWVVKRVLDAGLAKYAWQTVAWSGGQWDDRAQLRQESNGHKLGGHDVDFDHATTSAFGQWMAHAPKPKPVPKPVPPPPPPGPKPKPVPPPVPKQLYPSTFWGYAAWRDEGSVPAERPSVKSPVPLAWVYRYWLHKGTSSPLPQRLRGYLNKRFRV